MDRENCLQNLNRALKELALENDRIVFLGEDIKDPYGGSFKVERGLSNLFPDRVISTPISEESIAGMAVGMAMQGYVPIVDFMFSDFMALAFDMVVNFASKYVTMYGQERELPLIARCANGGWRGYGPTHSQSMQKYFMGIPNVSVYEMTCFHDNKKVLERMLQGRKPCIFFEEKSLYAHEMHAGGEVNGIFRFHLTGSHGNWAVVSSGSPSADVAAICPGGCSDLCLRAAETLLMEDEMEIRLYIPSRLYPSGVSEVYEELARIGKVLIVEESTQGADWGSVLLSDMNRRSETGKKVERVLQVASADAVIPACRKREERMLVSEADVVDGCRRLVYGGASG